MSDQPKTFGEYFLLYIHKKQIFLNFTSGYNPLNSLLYQMELLGRNLNTNWHSTQKKQIS